MITAIVCLIVGFGLGELHALWEAKSDEIDAVLEATREGR